MKRKLTWHKQKWELCSKMKLKLSNSRLINIFHLKFYIATTAIKISVHPNHQRYLRTK
jgi:hypothetical protein